MTRITSFAEAEAALQKYIPLAHEIIGKDITLERMWPLMDAIGSPERRLKVIHVAGTSGKTSTAYFIANLLTLAGRKTGLTVSPHLDSITERVQVNMLPLNEAGFCSELSEFLHIIEKLESAPTYYELLIAFAYWHFDRIDADYVVIETGLGGLHDGSNVARRSDKVCVITDIGLDHMHVLGHTVTEIAAQKAGIIHAGNQIFMHQQPVEVTHVVQEHAAAVGATLRISQGPEDLKLPQSTPEFQARNFTLAYDIFRHVKDRDGLPDTHGQKALRTYVPGRMDAAVLGDTTIVMDGAHNEQKMQAFVRSFTELHPGLKVPVLLALKRGKEFAAVLPLLRPITSRLIITEFTSGQDRVALSIDAHELTVAAQRFGYSNVIAEPDLEKGYELLRHEAAPLGVITGSLYLLGQLRNGHPELRQE